jgi:saccharopine dehydrogenase (NAD+, L-lysine forming)
MSGTVTFGIVGGYGATGKIVASELWKCCDGEILIGGRDLARVKLLAAEFDGRASAAQLDVLDPRSLDDFCHRCSTVVNCAGPVMILKDRLAQAAFRRRCHYIDAAGMSLVKERLLPHSREIEELGLRFVVSAGWMPGISEILPVYADS